MMGKSTGNTYFWGWKLVFPLESIHWLDHNLHIPLCHHYTVYLPVFSVFNSCNSWWIPQPAQDAAHLRPEKTFEADQSLDPMGTMPGGYGDRSKFKLWTEGTRDGLVYMFDINHLIKLFGYPILTNTHTASMGTHPKITKHFIKHFRWMMTIQPDQ